MKGKIVSKDGLFHALDIDGTPFLSRPTSNLLKVDLASLFRKIIQCPTIEVVFDGDDYIVNEMEFDYDGNRFQWDSNISWIYETER